MEYYDIIKQLCNIIASILFSVIYYPQIKRLIKTNNTAAFSKNYLKILLIAYFFYTVFLIMDKLYILLISSIINTICIIFMYYKKEKNIRRKRKLKEEMNKNLKEMHNIIVVTD